LDGRAGIMKNAARFPVLLVLGFSMLACNLAYPEASNEPPERAMSYTENVIAIDKSVGELFAVQALVEEKSFAALAANGPRNIDECIRFLEADHSYQQKMIAICSMHKLTLSEYIRFLRGVMRILDCHRISPELMGLAISPGYRFSTLLIENYKQVEVQEVLTEIAASKDVSTETKAAIASIKSGRALHDLECYRAACLNH
jgi:hypothetical protein